MNDFIEDAIYKNDPPTHVRAITPCRCRRRTVCYCIVATRCALLALQPVVAVALQVLRLFCLESLLCNGLKRYDFYKRELILSCAIALPATCRATAVLDGCVAMQQWRAELQKRRAARTQLRL